MTAPRGVSAVGVLPSRLYAIVDPSATDGHPVDAVARGILAGGARLLQLRMKDAPTAVLLDVSRALRELTRTARATFVVNDRPDVALAVGADGVHLGADDLPVASARRLLGPRALIGFSTHDIEEAAVVAATQPVSYIAFGPIFPTTTKEMPHAPQGLARLRELRARVSLPIVAIGGISEATAPAVRAAGADAVAMIGELARAPDVAALVTRLLQTIDG